MRFIDKPGVEALFKETRIVLHVDNRYRGDIIKQIHKINGLDNEYSLEIKKKRNGEEKTAQGYIWSMINKIAEKKNRDPATIYKELIKSAIPIHAVYYDTMGEAKKSKEEFESLGLGYMVLKLTDYKDYVKCDRVRGYSGWTFQEVEKFIEKLEKECKELGITEGNNDRVDKTTSVYLE